MSRRTGAPGPSWSTCPRTSRWARRPIAKDAVKHRTYHPRTEPDPARIEEAVELLARAERPVFYVGGGVINAGPEACAELTELVRATGYPITLTLMGLGAFPASDPQFIGMLGMHGTYEANLAMHDCDVMVCIGARFDDRVTGRLDGFSPHSKKIHVDIEPSSINKNVGVDLAIVGDADKSLAALAAAWRRRSNMISREKIEPWWRQIQAWRKKDSDRFRQNGRTSSRRRPCGGSTRLTRHLTPTSRPTSVSTRCGRRSTSRSTGRCAG